MKIFMQRIFTIVAIVFFAYGYSVFAKINFASKDSALIVKDDATLNVGCSQMVIDAGTLRNTGIGKVLAKSRTNNVRFLKGKYTIYNSVSDITGTLVPRTGGINLGNNPFDDGDIMISNPGGLNNIPIKILPGQNIIRGQPVFLTGSVIEYASGYPWLVIAVQSTIDANIVTNGGVLALQSDLHLGSNSVIDGNGIVVFNDRRLLLGGVASEWNSHIVWDFADIQLNSQATLKEDGRWSFADVGQINGSGNIIDIAQGGQIVVLPYSKLSLSGVQIKGVGSGLLKVDATSELHLSDVVIEFDSDYDFDSGNIFIDGDCKFIVKDHIVSFKDSIDGTSRGKLTVDRVSLTYDTLSFLDKLNIQPPVILDPEHNYISILGDGEIGTVRRETITYQNYKSPTFLQRFAIVTQYTPLTIYPVQDDHGNLNYNVDFNGNANFLGFTKTDEKVLFIDKKVQLVMRNVIMRDFSPKHVNFGQDSTLTFGDKTIITLSRDENLTYGWEFTGEVNIRGGGATLDLSSNGALVVKGAGSRLTLENLIIKGVHGTNITCTDPAATVIFKNCTIIQDSDFYFYVGNVEFMNNVFMMDTYNFTFASMFPSVFYIRSNSTLNLIRDKILTIAPIGGNRNAVVFEDASAALLLDEATLSAPAPGIQMTMGRFIVRNYNYLQNDGGTAATGITLGSGIAADTAYLDQTGTLEQVSGYFTNNT